jgi:tetratricopeptide (TPR) repeat protein
MGFAYAQLGEADPAVACFERALELKPAFRVAIENLLVFLDTSDRIERCEAGLAEKSLPPEDRYMLLIHCANAQWAIGSYDDLRRSLYRAHKVRPADSTSGRVAVMRVFDLFLRRLIKFRRTNPKEFRTDARKTIYAIGDSHTLSYANTMLPLGETSYKVVARCLLPDYAWRFAEGKPNGTVAAFQHAVKDLPEKALVLCSFGESDCSIGTGIMKFLKRTGGEVEKVVAEEVRRYVNGVVKLVKQRRLQVFFLGIPASRPDAPSANAPTVTEQERELRRKIVAAFNDHLRRATTDVGHAYVDVFGMTANAGGFADGRMHLDPIHLRPDALRKAPIYLLGTRM